MRIFAALAVLLALALPARAEDGACRSVESLTGEAMQSGWTLLHDLQGAAAARMIADLPPPLGEGVDEVALFQAPDASAVLMVGVGHGCAVWAELLRAAGNEI